MKNYRHRTRLQRGLIFALGLVLWPSQASAHLVTTGQGPVYDGIGHLLLTPEDLVPALAIALLAGMRGAALGRRALFVLPLTWFVGGCLGVLVDGLPEIPVPAFSFFVLGLLVAVDLKLPHKALTAIFIVVGFIHGVLNGVALKEGAGILGLIGIMVALFILVAMVSALTVSLKRPWSRIVIRVAGSWVAAIGLLMFGWLMRGQG